MAVSLTSDTFHELSCTPCSEEDVNKEAAVFCINCTQYFCKACSGFHDRVAGAGEHHLLEKEEFHRIPIVKKVGQLDLLTEKCPKHQRNLIDMYCGDHDEIGCNVCMALEHRQCTHLHYIPDIASSHLSPQSVKAVLSNISDCCGEFKTVRQGQINTKTRMASEKSACLDNIQKRRKAINEYLDQEEKIVKENLNDNYKKSNTRLVHDMKTCDESIKLLDTMKGKLKSTHANASQTFIDLKLAEHATKETWFKLDDYKRSRNDRYTITYKEGPDLDKVISPDDLFGSVVENFDATYALIESDDINVRFESDLSECNCYGLCQLSDGTIIITDWKNINIKSLNYNITYNQCESLSMSNSPWGVCTVNDTEVAVTIPDDQIISLVSISPKMAVKKSFFVVEHCHGITHDDEYLYIGHGFASMMTVYDLKGNHLKTFLTDQTGTVLFIRPFHLCTNPGKQQIVVADCQKGVVIIDQSGSLVAEHPYPSRNMAQGVCMDDNGHMFIADNGSKQLLVINKNGTVTTLLDNLFKRPRAVLFDKHTDRLLVLYGVTDIMQTFTRTKHVTFNTLQATEFT